ncbi:MAG: hypothetical protein K0U93_00840 [Gammaproteobacteria bacterium]|nr:hypothetical protein [Gammaproteobacteria bacterium]
MRSLTPNWLTLRWVPCVLFFVILGVGGRAMAQTAPQDEASPTPSAETAPPSSASPCVAPMIPTSVPTVDAYNIFVDKAKTYQKCVDAYVKEQQALSDKHAKLGSAAAAAWNQFTAKVADVRPPAPQ